MTEYPGFNNGLKLPMELVKELQAVVAIRGRIAERHWRRIFLRSLFAMIESSVSQMKGRALEIEGYGKVEFSAKLLKILNEGSRVAQDDGTIEWEFVRPGTKENVKAAVRAFAKSLGTETPLGGEARLPSGFSVALGARNRVTHPKGLQDLAVSDEEVSAGLEILQWFMKMAKWSKDQELRNIDEIRSEMNRQFDELRQQILGRGGPEHKE